MSGAKKRRLIPVVLAGGRGTRLWPLSRDDLPKQFLPLVSPQSLFQQTLQRSGALRGFDVARPIIVAGAGHRELVFAQARAVGVEPECVLLEPFGRNTAPAIALAALVARQRADDDALLLVMPADHVIKDTSAFADAISVAAVAAAEGRLATFGVVPDRPETGYGYIQRGAAHGEWADVRRFVEKPDLPTATYYIESGDYLWNSGIFLFSARSVLDEMRMHAPPVVAGCERVLARVGAVGGLVQLDSSFEAVPSISIDYAVMEKTANAAVVPVSVGWSDVGSWVALHELADRDEQGNSSRGEVVLESCSNTFVMAGKRLVAAVGLEDVVIIETDDVVLVMRRDQAQQLSRLVERVNLKGRLPR
jgi:mannose-1-phosphate guanylyltransferase/mannose-6-phosphate isomerase